MALENATKISELVPANPPGADPKSQGDDHLRMIKTCLQAVVDQATAEDDTSTEASVWSPERVAQAISAWITNNPQQTQRRVAMASKSDTQNIAEGASAEVVFNVEDVDDASWMVSGVYTPQDAGVYWVTASLDWASLGGNIRTEIRKNDVVVALGAEYNSSSATALVDMNGTTDKISIYATNGASGARDVGGDVTRNYLHIYKVRGPAT